MDPKLSGPYGALPAILGGKATKAKLAQDAAAKSRPALPVLVGCLFIPWLIFASTFWLRSFELRYDSGNFANLLCLCILLPVLVFAWMTFNLMRSGDPKYMGFLTFACFAYWTLGFCLGDANFQSFMRPFYDLNNLNVYPSVDPSKYGGNQLMDAGMIQFTKGSSLWLQKSIGFKNEDIYCVAPIRSANNTQSTFDFWAVGINCCSGHAPDFRCGEYTNPLATWGLRLMDDSRRDMFRLAVKEAEASFNLKAPHPVFLYWLSDPTTEVNAYQDDGLKYFSMSVFMCFAVQLFLVLCAVAVFAKI